MSQTIYLAAIVLRDERMLFVRQTPSAPWELPGGELLPEHDDVDTGMDTILAGMGVNAPAIEDDFVHTLFMSAPEGQLVYNIYAPSEWRGEPTVPEGVGTGWFTFAEIESIEMDEGVRRVILEAYGIREPEDDTSEIMAVLGNLAGFGTPENDSVPPTSLANGKAGHPRLVTDLSGLDADETAAAERASSGLALDQRTRALEVLGIVAAVGGGPADIKAIIENLLNLGAPAEEIMETLRLVGVYAGFPAARKAWQVMEGVFATHGIRPARGT